MATNLEMQALNLVNEEIMGPEVRDIDKYNELLDSRKNRKAVSMPQFSYHFRVKICLTFLRGKLRIKWVWPWANLFRMFQT